MALGKKVYEVTQAQYDAARQAGISKILPVGSYQRDKDTRNYVNKEGEVFTSRSGDQTIAAKTIQKAIAERRGEPKYIKRSKAERYEPTKQAKAAASQPVPKIEPATSPNEDRPPGGAIYHGVDSNGWGIWELESFDNMMQFLAALKVSAQVYIRMYGPISSACGKGVSSGADWRTVQKSINGRTIAQSDDLQDAILSKAMKMTGGAEPWSWEVRTKDVGQQIDYDPGGDDWEVE